MIAKNKTRITITIEKETLDHLKTLSKKWNISISDLINDNFAPFKITDEILYAKWIDE